MALVAQESGANAVFAVESDGDTCFLRLTDPASRTFEDVEGEVAFLAHLSASGVWVAMPVPSSTGRAIETVDGCFAVLPGCTSRRQMQRGARTFSGRGEELWHCNIRRR